jgi:uracil-DNA glycosylase family 4
MSYDPRTCGARCDECPLGPKGEYRDGHWQPVPPEKHTGATILAVAEMPHVEDANNGRPLSGRSGAEWNNALLAVGFKRSDVDLTHVVACSAGAQANAWEKMTKALDKANRRRLAQGLPVLPDPITCCRPRLLAETDAYENIVAMGRVAANSLTGKAQSIFSLRGGPVWVDENYGALLETPLAGEAVPDGAVRKVFPILHPNFVQRSPGWRHVLHADLGKALRWFSGRLRWTDPVRTFNPSPDVLEAFLARASPFWAYDLETDGIESMVCQVRSIAIAHPDLNAEGRALREGQEEAVRCEVMGLNILSGDGSTRYYEPADEARILDILRRFFLDTSKVKVGHNAGYYDRQVVEQWLGVTPMPIIDTLFAARFRAPELPKGLKVVGSVLTDVDRWETTEKGESLAFGNVDDWDRLAYNCTDSSVNARIVVPLMDAAEEAGAFRDLPEALRPKSWAERRWDLHELDHATQDMCVNLHKIGVYVDQEARFKMEMETRASVVKREKRLSELAAAVGLSSLDLKSAGANDDGEEVAGVKPGSADQIRDLLYEEWKLGIPPNMEARDFYTASGMPGTGDKVLRGHLAGGRLTPDQEAFVRELRLYRREKNKILGTVLLPLNLTAHDPKKGVIWHPDGRVRSTWNAHVTAPGRLSSSGPNLQNIGSRKGQGKLKTLFAAEPGHLLIGADLDQAHLRITANYWRIPLLLECFSEGKDPHNTLSYNVFGDKFKNADGWGPEGFSLYRKPAGGMAKAMRDIMKTFRYACAVEDTLVATLGPEGHKRIADIEPGVDWTWCWDGAQYVPARIIQKTKVGVRKCMTITMRDGRKRWTETFTPDHKFMLRDGSWRELQDLRTGDRLMPFKRWTHPKTGYRYLDPFNDNSRALEHRWVLPGHAHVHHKDGAKDNNHPDNLEGMTASEHSKHHWTPDRTAAYGEASRAMWALEHAEMNAALVEGRKRSEKWRQAASEAMRRNGKLRKTTNEGKRFTSKLDAFVEFIGHEHDRDVAKRADVTEQAVRYYRKSRDIPAYWRGQTDTLPNHIVECIEFAGEHEVWDIGVDHEAHNFALASGIFVHNCIYWADPMTVWQVLTATEADSGEMPYLGMTSKEVRHFHETWLKNEPEWMEAWEAMLHLYRHQGFMEEPVLGRRSGGLSDGKKNEVVNFPILAAEASLMRLAEQALIAAFPWDHARKLGLIHQCHDSVAVEIAAPNGLEKWKPTKNEPLPEELERLRKIVEECMTVRVPGWEVPLTAEASVGRNLKEA